LLTALAVYYGLGLLLIQMVLDNKSDSIKVSL